MRRGTMSYDVVLTLKRRSVSTGKINPFSEVYLAAIQTSMMNFCENNEQF